MADVAEECLTSLRFGSHWLLKIKLMNHGINAMTREDGIKQARKLCAEFMTAYMAEEA